ncbi:MAG: MarR family transcriptional regulator [Gammaproteobacteria bacterium]
MASKRTSGKRASAAPVTVSRRELLIGESDEAFRHFIHGLLAFGERMLAVRAGFGELIGLSGIQYTVLVSIAHLQTRHTVSVGAVAAHLHLSGAFITTVTNQLVSAGFIRKSRAPGDRRVAVLVTTPKAQQSLDQLAPMQRQVNDQLFAPLTRAHFEELSRSMDSWIESGDRAVALLDYLKHGPVAKTGS